MVENDHCGTTNMSGDEFSVNESNAVFLNVYDLSADMLRANHILNEVMNIGGAFHTGVEVYGREYADFSLSGVCFYNKYVVVYRF